MLPSKTVIGAICASLLELLFPAAYENEPIDSPDLKNATARRLRDVASKLVTEISKSSKLPSHPTTTLEIEEAVLRCLRELPRVR